MNTQTFFSILDGMSWLLIFPVMYLFISFIHHKRRNWDDARPKTAIDILKERYAKGDIDKAKFDEIKKDL